MESSSDNFDICNNECKRLIEKYGSRNSITYYPRDVRCVVLIWTAIGKIENGGFEYLFQTKLPGDSYYKQTLESFKVIGCNDAYKSFKDALCQFPECSPPLDDNKRIQLYKLIPENVRDELDSSFWNVIDKVIVKLAQYIKIKMIE